MKIKMKYENKNIKYQFEEIIIMNKKPSKIEIQNKCIDRAKSKAINYLDNIFEVFSSNWWNNYYDIRDWTEVNKISAEVIEE